VNPLLAGVGNLHPFAEPALHVVERTFLAAVSLPAGKAGLRRQFTVALVAY
jgi:hypothetical protein